ncbi:MAG: T9SS type A sorting domain-containing protein [Draconibacterium sp.]|nr:T9SS type A sorting domain-containing protein [Draconibacterium sp.]
MKQITLLTIAIFICIVSFSQNNISNPSNLSNSFINEKQNSPELKIYPNPSKNGKVTIDFNTHKISEIQLTNITGKQVFRKKFTFAENKKQLQLNDIPNGMYLLKVKSIDNKIVVQKFIISKE